MKTLTTAALLCIFSAFVNAQYSFNVDKVDAATVPEAVKSSFAEHYPGTDVVRWEKHVGKGKFKSRTRFVAIFNDDKNRARSRYHNSGIGISATTYYFAPGLPKQVKKGAMELNPGFKVVAGQKIRIFKNERIVYRVKLRKGTSRVWTYVNPDGSEAKVGEIPDEVTEDQDLE